jgi:hypothetical protein
VSHIIEKNQRGGGRMFAAFMGPFWVRSLEREPGHAQKQKKVEWQEKKGSRG